MNQYRSAIAIITPKAHIYSNPALLTILEKLTGRNYKVFLIAPPQKFKNISFFNNVSVLKYFPPYFSRFPRRPEIIIKTLFSYFYVIRMLKKNKVKLMVGVDPEGIVIAGRLNKILKVVLGYLSFEILFHDELLQSRYYMLMKKKEIMYSKNIQFLIIQDEERKNLLLNENHIDSTRTDIFSIPVSPSEIARVKDPDIKRKLGIPAGKTVILYSGTIADWTGAKDIVESLEKNWDDRLWLLVHSYSKLPNHSATAIKIEELIKNKYPVSLHNEPFESYYDYSAFVCNFEAGFVYYKPNVSENVYMGKNTEFIGLSSGKFSTFMMHGLPVVFNRNPFYKKLLKKYDFGTGVDRNEDLPLALADILTNYKKKSDAARMLYADLLNPDKTIPPLINYIEKKLG